MDVAAYAAQIAAQLGAHIIKVKPPTDFVEIDAARKAMEAARRQDGHPGRAGRTRRAERLQRHAAS